MTPTISVLEREFTEVNRPYSQEELNTMRTRAFKSMRIGKVKAHHRKSGYSYFVKENGRKEKEIIENKDCDSGNCSVSWKLNKTPRHLRSKARDLIDQYMSETEYRIRHNVDYLDYYYVDLEIRFYTWLYQEDF